jgi:protein-tyrosine phosphatase
MASPALTPDRLIDLEGCFNFRDLGGYHAADGRSLRWRHLFRADGLYRLTEVDLDQLGALGLRTVIDLRTLDEITARGRIEWPSADLAYHHLPMMDVLPTRDEYADWTRPEDIAGQYVDILRTGRATIVHALNILADPASYPAVYHCMAGKDRTGILSAIVLGLVGVSDEDILADYALSGAAMVRMLEWIRATRPEAAAELGDRATAIAAAAPRTMGIFLERFRREHGSFGQYATALGLGGLASQLQGLLLGP